MSLYMHFLPLFRLVLSGHDWVIYVTDIGQESHFMKIFKAARKMGWHRVPDVRVDHVGFGLIQVRQ